MASVAVPTSTQAKAPEASVPPVMSLPRKLTGCAQWLTKTNVVLPSPSLRQSAAATLPLLLLLLLLLPLPLPLPLPPLLLPPLPPLLPLPPPLAPVDPEHAESATSKVSG